MSPEVSVVMSVYNGERYLREALEGILNQTFADFEFIVVDDGSTDDTWHILAAYAENDHRIKLHRNAENIGLTKSLNRALRMARGRYIARQDTDDVSLPGRLAAQVAYLQNHPKVGLLGTVYFVMDQRGQLLRVDKTPASDTAIRWKMLFHNAFCHTSVMLRGELLEAGLALYDENLPYSQDYELWVRLLDRVCGANLQQPLVMFRVHEDSLEAIHFDEQQCIARAIAGKQIKALIPYDSIGDPEIDQLRLWEKKFPKRLTRREMALCQILWQILREFGKKQNMDPDVIRDIRRRYIARILSATPIWGGGDLWKSGLLKTMFRDASLSVLANIPKQAVRRMVRHIQSP